MSDQFSQKHVYDSLEEALTASSEDPTDSKMPKVRLSVPDRFRVATCKAGREQVATSHRIRRSRVGLRRGQWSLPRKDPCQGLDSIG
jgi:hypothetical protein